MKPYLQSAHIRNFQINKDLEIKFSPITTIVGESDQGKSSIFRALRWVASNSPKGSSFINWDAKETSVTLESKSGSVTRRRGKSVNTYEVNGHKLESFGNNPPEEALKALGLSSINFQGQYDSPFWFTLSPGEVSRSLNKIVNLNKIDETLSAADSIVKKSKMRMEIKREELKSKKEERKRLSYVKDMYSDFRKIELAEEYLKKISEKEATIEKIVSVLIQNMEIVDSGVKKYEQGMEILELGKMCEELARKESTLGNLISSIESLQKNVDFHIPSIDSIEKLYKDIQALEKREAMLEEIIKNIEEGNNTIWEGNKYIERWEKDFSKNMGKVCPLCKQKIK